MIESAIEYFGCKGEYFLECKYALDITRIISESFMNIIDIDMNKAVLLFYKNLILCKNISLVTSMLPSIIKIAFHKMENVKQVCRNVAELIDSILNKYEKDGYDIIIKVINELNIEEECKTKFAKELWDRKGKSKMILYSVQALCKALKSNH